MIIFFVAMGKKWKIKNKYSWPAAPEIFIAEALQKNNICQAVKNDEASEEFSLSLYIIWAFYTLKLDFFF